MPSSSARSSTGCSSSGISPISSRHSVPPCASSNRPGRPSAVAPVNAPRTWPNNSPAISSFHPAPQLYSTNRPAPPFLAMYGARKQLFADPGFALDQNRHALARKLPAPVDGGQYRRTLPLYLREAAALRIGLVAALGEAGVDGS